MGAWNYKNFGNDDALDFIHDILESGFEIVTQKIEMVASKLENEYLEAPEANEALVSIEIITALKGNPSNDFPDNLSEWLQKNPNLKVDDLLIGNSVKALNRILNTNSEIKELWEENENDYILWKEHINNLKQRLK